MARPTKNNCDYFPHLTTMRNHRKVKALRNKFGQVLGYAFWAMFIEYLTEQDGCEVENSEIELEMFAGELGVSVTEIQEMVDYCVRIEMLFLNKDNFIYSESLNDNLLPVFEKRKKAKEISRTRERRENGTFIPDKPTTSGVTTTKTPQIREDKSKVKKSRVNNIFIKPTFDEVKAYCLERNNGIDPQNFLDSNDAKGWVVGKNRTPIKDWMAVIRTWEKYSPKKTANLGVGETINEQGQRIYGNKSVVPMDAPPRPSSQHYWDSKCKNWGVM